MIDFAEVRALATALPETTEQLAWEDETTWRVRDKIFAMGTAESGTVALKATREDQAELVASRPGIFAVSPYVGRYGWVSVTLAEVDPGEFAELLVDSWRLIAPKRLVAAYDSDNAR